MLYKEALAKLESSRAMIVYNDRLILLKNGGGCSLVRNEGKKQTRFKTVKSLKDIEDDWIGNEDVKIKSFAYDEDASFWFRTIVSGRRFN